MAWHLGAQWIHRRPFRIDITIAEAICVWVLAHASSTAFLPQRVSFFYLLLVGFGSLAHLLNGRRFFLHSNFILCVGLCVGRGLHRNMWRKWGDTFALRQNSDTHNENNKLRAFCMKFQFRNMCPNKQRLPKPSRRCFPKLENSIFPRKTFGEVEGGEIPKLFRSHNFLGRVSVQLS